MSEPVLRVVGVRRRRGGRVVLAGASLEVAAGEIVAIVGENGSGKSTLLQIVAGVLGPDAGSIEIAGHALATARPRALAALGFAPDRPDFPPSMRVDEWLALVAALRRARHVEPADLDAHGVGPLVGKPLASLSLGQARRVMLLAASIGSPRLLVLDEPTNGLDPAALDALAARLRDRARGDGAVLVATHDRAFASAIGARIEPIERVRDQGA